MGGVFRKETDVIDSTIPFGVVHSIADYELIGNFESYIVCLNGNETSLGLVKTGCDLERCGFVLEHEAAQIVEGQSGIQDVLDDDDILALDGVVDVLDELHGAGGYAGAPVARYSYEIEGVVHLDSTGQVGEEDGCTFEHADEDDGFAGIIVGDLCSNLSCA